MTAKVVPMPQPKKPASPPTVTPETGWVLHSPYGALQDIERRPLERLEAIHALLMKRDGLTSMDAAIRVFGPFVSDANSEVGMRHGAAKLRRFLMHCDKADRAYSLFPAGKYADQSQQDRLVELVPHVAHHQYDRNTPDALMYALGQMAGEVWAPYSGDFDLNDRPCAEFAEGYFPSVAKAREILGPLAVRHDLAHKLWGWGTVVVAAPVAGAQSAAPLAVAPKKVPQRAQAPEWTPQRLASRQTELKKLHKDFTAKLADECGLPKREISRRIKATSGAMGQMAGSLNQRTG